VAQKQQIVLVDDFNGKPAKETVPFGLDGVSYTIDLTATNAKKLRGDLKRFVVAARRINGRRSVAGRKPRAAGAVASAKLGPQIRAWAAANGYNLTGRGRIPNEVKQAYQAATTA
jgi:hypothetical protein